MSSDRQWMWINEYNWYEICARIMLVNMKTWTSYNFERFQWLKWHNSQIDWIHKIVKFNMQYCQSNCLHRLSWYVHDHDYMNMIQYELSLSDNTMLFWNNNESLISSQNMMLFENNKHILFKICQIWAESFYMLA